MRAAGEIDLGLGLLDRQLVDSEGRRCGKVDDLEFDDVRGPSPKVEAIVVGVDAWRTRGLLARVAASVARTSVVRVSWNDVEEVAAGVELKHTARRLRLGRGDERARAIVERIPGSQ